MSDPDSYYSRNKERCKESSKEWYKTHASERKAYNKHYYDTITRMAKGRHLKAIGQKGKIVTISEPPAKIHPGTIAMEKVPIVTKKPGCVISFT
jgi:hypothetical protein